MDKHKFINKYTFTFKAPFFLRMLNKRYIQIYPDTMDTDLIMPIQDGKSTYSATVFCLIAFIIKAKLPIPTIDMIYFNKTI